MLAPISFGAAFQNRARSWARSIRQRSSTRADPAREVYVQASRKSYVTQSACVAVSHSALKSGLPKHISRPTLKRTRAEAAEALPQESPLGSLSCTMSLECIDGGFMEMTVSGHGHSFMASSKRLQSLQTLCWRVWGTQLLHNSMRRSTVTRSCHQATRCATAMSASSWLSIGP